MMKALIPIIAFLAGFYLYTFLKYRKKKRNLKASSEVKEFHRKYKTGYAKPADPAQIVKNTKPIDYISREDL